MDDGFHFGTHIKKSQNFDWSLKFMEKKAIILWSLCYKIEKFSERFCRIYFCKYIVNPAIFCGISIFVGLQKGKYFLEFIFEKIQTNSQK